MRAVLTTVKSCFNCEQQTYAMPSFSAYTVVVVVVFLAGDTTAGCVTVLASLCYTAFCLPLVVLHVYIHLSAIRVFIFTLISSNLTQDIHLPRFHHSPLCMWRLSVPSNVGTI